MINKHDETCRFNQAMILVVERKVLAIRRTLNSSRLEARGDLDSAELLSSIVTDKTESKELRAQAANMDAF